MNKYENLIDQLKSEGYIGFLRELGDLKYIFGGIPDEKTLMKPNQSFNIFIENNFKVEYFIGHLKTEKEFKTIEELLKFVRQVFPIEE
ncbi:hypothetical protein [Chryseobacterium gambrini]|uniref:hypothetical protein n=1 Tax=Chryseobacterium gambrini TaxID=373672 RepID=UPI003BA58C2C